MAGKKTTLEVAELLLTKYNLTLEGEYLGAHKPIQFRCPGGHSNKAIATNVIQRGYKCKECLYSRPITTKLEWDAAGLEKLRTMLETPRQQVENIAKEFNTTVNVIHNTCVKYSIPNNIKTNTTIEKAQATLDLQGRELVDIEGRTITSVCNREHKSVQFAGNILYKNTGCPQCQALSQTSLLELELKSFIESNYKGWTIYNDRTILGGQELDIVLPDLGLAIEFNGTYWHSEEKVGKTYHLDKTNNVERIGFKLLHVYDYYWTLKQSIVKSRILAQLGVLDKIYARKTTVVEISAQRANLFFEANHLQGKVNSSINLALEHGGELVACMSFSKPRFNKNYCYELTRYANRLNTTVVGGAGKLFANRPQGSIITYADRSYSQGDLYSRLGFRLEGATGPGYAWYKKSSRISRYRCQKHVLERLGLEYDPLLSEVENMRANGYHRVYDSGNLIYTLT